MKSWECGKYILDSRIKGENEAEMTKARHFDNRKVATKWNDYLANMEIESASTRWKGSVSIVIHSCTSAAFTVSGLNASSSRQ